MKCTDKWSFEHYLPLNRDDGILIDQVLPGERKIELSWTGGESKWNIYYGRKGSIKTKDVVISDETKVTISGLSDNEDYEFYVESGTKKSRIGFARTGAIPGTVVNYLHPEDTKYDFSGQHLCTPSILRRQDGYLLASMDVFEGKCPQNLTLIFRSDDEGNSWYHLTELFPCFWGTLFLHRGEVYMLATSTEYGDLLIGKSTDGGKNWEKPTVLARGSSHHAVPGWHKSSMPVIEYKNRLWCGVDYGSHESGRHMTCLVSANINGDLLDASNWEISSPLKYNKNWEGAVAGDNRGFIEGNAVVLPNGEIGNMLRYFTNGGTPSYGLAGILQGSCENPGKALELYRFVKFPGNLSKFDVKKDEKSGLYFSICSRILDGGWVKMRNLLSLTCSKDLENWVVLSDLINWTDMDPQKVGLQYVSYAFDGDDIIYLSRTAFNGAQSYHDNNYITFHRIKDFRSLIPSTLKTT